VIVLSSNPPVIEFDSDLPDAVFDRLMEITNYSQSMGWDSTIKESTLSDYRVSQTYYDLNKKFNGITKMLLGKIYSLTGHEYFVEQTEEIQLTKYLPGEYFKRHWDNFNKDDNEPIDNDRIATIILYLNDDFEGGETVFNRLGISITPKRGKVCYFSYPMGSDTTRLEHEAKPLVSGEKKIIQIWIRDREWKG